MAGTISDEWTGRNVRLNDVEQQLLALHAGQHDASEGPEFRTRVMTHCAWVPLEWLDAARETLAGLAERHPSRSIILVPEPDADDGLDADVRLECFVVEGVREQVCSEVI